MLQTKKHTRFLVRKNDNLGTDQSPENNHWRLRRMTRLNDLKKRLPFKHEYRVYEIVNNGLRFSKTNRNHV